MVDVKQIIDYFALFYNNGSFNVAQEGFKLELILTSINITVDGSIVPNPYIVTTTTLASTTTTIQSTTTTLLTTTTTLLTTTTTQTTTPPGIIFEFLI